MPGMDEAAANSVAAMILAGREPLDVAVDQSVVHGSVHREPLKASEMQSAPGNPGADVGSGGRI